MKRITIIAMLLIGLTGATFAQTTSDTWDYFGFYYHPPDRGEVYTIEFASITIIPANEAKTVWVVFGYTGLIDGVRVAGEVALYFERYPAFLKRQGEEIEVVGSFNGISQEYGMPTFYVLEVRE